MKKRLIRVIFGMVSIAILGLMVHTLVRHREPVYQGRSVTTWIKLLAEQEARDWPRVSSKRYNPVAGTTPSKGMAMNALKTIGPPAVPYLVTALGKQNGVIRDKYQKLYASAGSRWGRWLPEPPVDAVYSRLAAVSALGEIPDVAKVIWPALLVAATKDADGGVRYRAIETLKALGEHNDEVNRGLSERLLMLRLPAAQVVQIAEQYGLRAPSAIQALVHAAKEGPTTVRDAAIKQLRVIGPAAREAGPYLVSALTDTNATIRCHTCQALAAIKPEAQLTVAALITALDDPDSLVRASAANALAIYGPQASSAVPKLAESYERKDGVEKFCLGRALLQIDPAAAAKLGAQ